MNVARALRFQSNVPMSYWSDCVLTIVYIINRTSTPLRNNKTPYEKHLNTLPSYKHMKVFGCISFASTLSHGRKKFNPSGRKCIILDYPFGVKGYKLMDLETEQVFISRDVIFHETVFPFKTNSPRSDFPNLPSTSLDSNFSNSFLFLCPTFLLPRSRTTVHLMLLIIQKCFQLLTLFLNHLLSRRSTLLLKTLKTLLLILHPLHLITIHQSPLNLHTILSFLVGQPKFGVHLCT